MKKLFLGVATLLWISSYSQTLLPGNTSTKLSLNSGYFQNIFNSIKVGYAGVVVATEKVNWNDAAMYARNNTSSLARRLDVISKYPGILNANDLRSSDSITRYLSYIVLAAQNDKDDLENYFKKSLIKNDEDKETIKISIDAIRVVINTIKKPTVSIFASGDIKGVASSQSSTNQSTGNSSKLPSTATGAIGIRWNNGKKTAISAQIAVASTSDSLKNNFAASLLNPASGKALGSGLLEAIFYKNENHALHVYSSFSSRLWSIDTARTRSASILGFGMTHYWKIFSGQIGEKTNVSLTAELGGSIRLLGGDVRSLLNEHTDSVAYTKVFASNKRTFGGLEGGFNLSFGDINAALQVYYYPKRDNFLGGLNDLQLSFGISINTSVVSDILR